MNTTPASRRSRRRLPLLALATVLSAGTLAVPLTSASATSEPGAEPAVLITPDTTWRYLLMRPGGMSRHGREVVRHLVEPQAPTPPPVGTPPSRVILTPTETPETSQSFTWLASSPEATAQKVQLRPAAGGPVRTVAARGQGRSVNQAAEHFSVTVTRLAPATEYSYRVGDDVGWSEWTTFSTADPADREFDYVYYGDAQIGLDTTWPKVVRMAEATAPDSIGSVHAGDLIDTASNDTQWRNWFAGMERSAATTNIFAAPGNHEYSGDRLMQSWKAHFEYPDNQPDTSTIGKLAMRSVGDTDVARQYQAYFDHWAEFARETVYFSDYQGVRFITVNATRDTTFLTPASLPACSGAECPSTQVGDLWTQYQAAWLDHVLETSQSKWNVVTFHQPVYSTSAGRNEPALRKHWVPVFQKHDIDLVQMGHDHTYARGFNNEDRTDVPGVTDGPVYVVSNSGAKHYDLETDERNVWTDNGATQVVKGAKVTTYQVVSVFPDKLVYRSYLAETAPGAYTVPARELRVGDVIDEFTIYKTDARRKAVVEAGAPAPDFLDPTPSPEPTATPTPTPTATPTATPAAQPAKVAVAKARLRVGRKARVWLRASTHGTARVTLGLGGRKVTRTVTVPGEGRTKVTLGRIGRKALRASSGQARVVVVLTPTGGGDSVSTARKVRVLR